MVQVKQEKPAQVVILAGGLGTRLGPLTQQMPKAMVPILGKPFIEYQLDWLARFDIRDIILSTGYLGEKIRDHVGNGHKWNVNVRYTDEGTQLRGTAGALRFVQESGYLQDRFLVTYGDSYLPIDFKSVWNYFLKSSSPALMTLLHNQGKWDKSNVAFDGKNVTLYDKKKSSGVALEYIDYGLSALTREVIENSTCSDLADLFHDLSVNQRLTGFEVKQRFYEIGSHSGILDLETYLKESAHK